MMKTKVFKASMHFAFCIAFLASPLSATSMALGKITGDLKSPGIDLKTTGPMVIYLESTDKNFEFAAPKKNAKISQKDAKFTPALLVLTAGQTVDMPNDDDIFHSVFSYSRPNDFKFEPYPKGHSRSIKLEHPGIVKIYCSIHEKMNATIVVSPTPHHVTVNKATRFTISDVPPGRYRIRTYGFLPSQDTEVVVEAGKISSTVVTFDSKK